MGNWEVGMVGQKEWERNCVIIKKSQWLSIFWFIKSYNRKVSGIEYLWIHKIHVIEVLETWTVFIILWSGK